MSGSTDTQKLIDANGLAAEAYASDRRGFIKHGLLFTAALGFWSPALAEAAPTIKGRELRLTNVHTGDKFHGEYWYDGKYSPEAFQEIKRVMRDFRTGE